MTTGSQLQGKFVEGPRQAYVEQAAAGATGSGMPVILTGVKAKFSQKAKIELGYGTLHLSGDVTIAKAESKRPDTLHGAPEMKLTVSNGELEPSLETRILNDLKSKLKMTAKKDGVSVGLSGMNSAGTEFELLVEFAPNIRFGGKMTSTSVYEIETTYWKLAVGPLEMKAVFEPNELFYAELRRAGASFARIAAPWAVPFVIVSATALWVGYVFVQMERDYQEGELQRMILELRYGYAQRVACGAGGWDMSYCYRDIEQTQWRWIRTLRDAGWDMAGAAWESLGDERVQASDRLKSLVPKGQPVAIGTLAPAIRQRLNQLGKVSPLPHPRDLALSVPGG